jgi:protocatechuate 3,4-dioxygenase beta subunit
MCEHTPETITGAVLDQMAATPDRTDEDGCYCLRTVRPLGYSIPLDGPVGRTVQAQGRHGMRPAHIHFLIGAPGYRELVTALYLKGDARLDDDVVFGASADLVAEGRGEAARSGLPDPGAPQHP